MVTKGKRSISVKMDKVREIRWTLPAVEKFEDVARDYLLGRGQIDEKTPITAYGVLLTRLDNAALFRAALECCLDIDSENVESALDSYSGSWGDLKRDIIEAFVLAEDPLRAASMRKSWNSSDELEMLKMQSKTEEIKAKIDDLKKKIEAFGHPESDSSNLDSDQVTSGS